MEKRHDKLNAELENLLLTKSFAQLKADEKTAVEAQLTQEEYAAFRKVLLESRQLFWDSQKHEAPLTSLRLKQLVRNKQNQSPIWAWLHWLINYPLPTWQPALGMLAIIAFFFSPFSYSAKSNPVAEPVYVYKVDTVYRNITDTIYREKPADEEAKLEQQAKAFSKTSKRLAKNKKQSSPKATKNNGQSRVVRQQKQRKQQPATAPDDLLALHVDSTIFNKNEPFHMKRDSGHSLNEVKGIMDFFVEIN
ncbi:MAG: hypothetical protein AAF985_13650 [Bacteroidota bacterium]